MGCCGSTEADVETVADAPVTVAETGIAREDEIKVSLNIAETDAVKAKPGVSAQPSCGARARACDRNPTHRLTSRCLCARAIRRKRLSPLY